MYTNNSITRNLLSKKSSSTFSRWVARIVGGRVTRLINSGNIACWSSEFSSHSYEMFSLTFLVFLAAASAVQFDSRPARQRFPDSEPLPPHNVNKRPVLTPDQFSPNNELETPPDGATVGRVALADGRRATILTYAGILAKDTRLPSYMDITLRQITDGTKVAQAVLGPFGNLMDCDVSFDQADISRFSEDFMTSQLKVNTANLTFVPRNGFDHKLEQLINLQQLVHKCHEYQRQIFGSRRAHSRGRGQRTKRSLLFPGTKWCGKGDEASQYGNLGINANTDRCCRQHDHCPYTILGFSSKFGLFNYRFHTVSHCDCDYSFRTCLKSSGTGAANMIGSIFFNVVRLPCFIFVPKSTCVRRAWLWGECEETKTEYVAEIQEALNYDTRV